jgi:hypothetical protein
MNEPNMAGETRPLGPPKKRALAGKRSLREEKMTKGTTCSQVISTLERRDDLLTEVEAGRLTEAPTGELLSSSTVFLIPVEMESNNIESHSVMREQLYPTPLCMGESPLRQGYSAGQPGKGKERKESREL